VTPVAAGTLVFFTSGCVLVLEVLAIRLLAPYVGVTLQTYTAIIGTVLAGIAAGTGVGGHLADRVEPRRLLGPLLVAGGASAAATVPLVRLLGEAASGSRELSVVGLTVASFLLPAAVLSAVSPTVVKLQLRDLAVTGRVVGRLSAAGTAGALAGTFLAGFVLVQAVPTSTAILGLGLVLAVLGAVVWAVRGPGGRAGPVLGVVVALVAVGVGAGSRDPCEVETTYHCARVVADPTRAGGRTLVLDTLRHSYVDLDDPTYLEFRYVRRFADVVDALAPSGPLEVLHLGGGGFTFPRWLAATRPGSRSTVLEIDGGLVALARDELGLVTGPGLRVVVGDARISIARLESGSAQVVVGDAFGGLAVPWHLTTAEMMAQVRRLLGPGGLYVLNVIDYPPRRFVRAEVATLEAGFAHVAAVAPPELLTGGGGGNYVLVASDAPLDAEALAAAIARSGGSEAVVTGPGLAGFVDGAPVLTDDKAPVDQWLGRPCC